MLDYSPQSAELQSTRWRALRFGLRLANSYFGLVLIGWFYALWALIGLILCLVFIPMAILGKAHAFENALKPIALYGFVTPMAVLAIATWALKCFSRLLWCAIPEPVVAALLAVGSVIGRLSLIAGAVYLWLRGGPLGKGLLLPDVVACSGIAWLGLVTEWGFIRILQDEFIPPANPAQSSAEMAHTGINSSKDRPVTEPHKESVFRRNLGEWFKSRFPKGYKLVVWILFPMGYAAVSSLADNGDPRTIPEAILRLAVIAPAILQIFWIPGDQIEGLINRFSQTVAPENVQSR
jgi:hypothetical protein